MALKRSAVVLTVADQDIYTVPVSVEASAHGITWSNTTSTDRVVTIKFYNALTTTTQTLLVATAYANKTYSLPKPLNMQAGDKIIANAAAASAITMVVSAYEDSASIALGFTPQGTWSNAASYNQNDIVYYNGSSYAASSLTGNINKIPDTQTTYWTPLAKGGTIALNATPVLTLTPIQVPTVTNSGTGIAGIFQFGLPRASTFSIGTVTTVNSTQSATVVRTADGNGDYSLAFNIPRGNTIAVNATPVLTVNPNVNPSVGTTTTNGDLTVQFSLPRASTVSVGTTTTLNSTQSAIVTNTGINGDTVLNFSVPRGNTVAINATPVLTVVPSSNPSLGTTTTNGDLTLQFSLPRARTFNTPAVTTLAAGSSATVSQAFDGNGDVTVTYNIPRGDPGYTGGTLYTFSTTLTDADPGNGIIRFNSATMASVTQIYIDLLDTLGTDQTAWLDQMDDSTSTFLPKGMLTIRGRDQSSNTSIIFDVTSVTTATGYRKLNVSYNSGSLPANAQVLSLGFSATGDKGDSGPFGPKAVTVSNPTSAENITLFYTTQALTLTNVISVVAGTTPSVTYSIYSGANRASVTTTHVSAAAVTNTTTGAAGTIAVASIPANTWVWIQTSATSGTVTSFSLVLNF